MATTPRILAFAGSLRKESFNKKLVRIAADGARDAGADVMLIDLDDYPMPIYHGDDEAADGLPENAKKLKKIMIDHGGLLIASPEYNSSISAALKNAIDWVSRPEDKNEKPLVAFDGKIAGLMSASPGALGGLRGLVHLRAILGNIRVHVIPDQIAISTAHEAFNADGSLKDAKKQETVLAIGRKVAEITAKLGG